MVAFSRRCHILIRRRDERRSFIVSSRATARHCAAVCYERIEISHLTAARQPSDSARRFGAGRLECPDPAERRHGAMQYGLFTMPSHPPERGLYDGHRWDLQTLRWADELGFTEAWIGEHHTAPWEPHPAPDLLIAQALMETS